MKIALSSNTSHGELNPNKLFHAAKGVFSYSPAFTVRQLKIIKLLVIFIWIIHNLLYLKGIITADYFSDDGIIIYMLIFILLTQAIKIKIINDI